MGSERFIKNIAKLENAGRNQILEDFKKRSAQINESPLCIDISSDIWTIFLEIWEQGMSSFSFWMQLATITLFLVLKLLCSVSPIFGLEIEMSACPLCCIAVYVIISKLGICDCTPNCMNYTPQRKKEKVKNEFQKLLNKVGRFKITQKFGKM